RWSAGAWPTLRRLFRLVSIQHCDIKSGKPPREEPGQDELGQGLVCLLPPLCPDDLARVAPGSNLLTKTPPAPWGLPWACQKRGSVPRSESKPEGLLEF